MTQDLDIPAVLRAAEHLGDAETADAVLKRLTAPMLLERAAQHQRDRAATYDRPDGERSMASTVVAFNAITGHALTEEHGWLLLALLKFVRDQHSKTGHRDSCEDAISYASLYAEARLA